MDTPLPDKDSIIYVAMQEPATSSSLPAIVMLFGPMNSMMAPISQWVWSLARPVLLRQEILRITVRKARSFDRLVSEHNREVVWTDCTHRGFVKLILTPESARAEYIVVNDVHSEQYRSSVLRKMNIVKRGNSLAFDL